MKITVIAVGHIKEKYLKEGINEYAKRLSRFCDLEIIEVDDEQVPDGISEAQAAQAKKKEAERIFKRTREGSCVIALDIKGKRLDSEGFASTLRNFFVSGVSNITFIIGGSIGLDEELLKTATLRLSMSDMTFPHKLARLILVEQLYRAFKIINNETYHK